MSNVCGICWHEHNPKACGGMSQLDACIYTLQGENGKLNQDIGEMRREWDGCREERDDLIVQVQRLTERNIYLSETRSHAKEDREAASERTKSSSEG